VCSQARRAGSGSFGVLFGVVEHPLVDHVGEVAFQRAQRLHGGLAFGQATAVVGAAGGLVTELDVYSSPSTVTCRVCQYPPTLLTSTSPPSMSRAAVRLALLRDRCCTVLSTLPVRVPAGWDGTSGRGTVAAVIAGRSEQCPRVGPDDVEDDQDGEVDRVR
jgi:hypothetical protein